jgi:myo-inositol-1(or 4)-monophosphatase
VRRARAEQPTAALAEDLGLGADGAPTSRIDLVAEQAALAFLDGLPPRWRFNILSEECGSLEGQADHQWIVDPLDGTINYAHNFPVFCVSIAYREAGDLKLAAIYDPMQDELFSAERGSGAALNGKPTRVTTVDEMHLALLGTSFPAADTGLLEKNNRVFVHISGLAQTIRRNGSAALDLAYVAAGRLDGYWQLGNSPWDFAAGALLIQEAGGVVVGLDGNPDFFHPPYSLIGAGASLAGLISEEIRRAG